MPLTWYLHDLKTGDRVTDLPLVAGTVEKILSTVSTLSVTLDVRADQCPKNWSTLVDPLRAMFVLDDGVNPLQGYYIDTDAAGGPQATWTLRSLEGIPDEVYCRTHDFVEGVDDESDQIAALLSDVVVPSFGFVLDVTKCGRTSDRSFVFEEDQRVGDAISDMSKAQGGPEWTVRLRWEDATRRRVVKTIVIGPQVGNVIESVVIENTHLAIGKRTRTGSYTRGDRATHVIATGTGSGAERPMSAAHVDQTAIDAGAPQWEARVNAPAIDEEAQLDRVALAGLIRRRRGVRTWQMQLTVGQGRRPGRDFDAGDTITIDSGPLPDDPEEWHGPARVIGWRADIEGSGFSTVTPVFYEIPEKDVS